MKVIAEYLEHALQFERFAAEEGEPKLKSYLEKQAMAYHRLADSRELRLGKKSPNQT